MKIRITGRSKHGKGRSSVVVSAATSGKSKTKTKTKPKSNSSRAARAATIAANKVTVQQLTKKLVNSNGNSNSTSSSSSSASAPGRIRKYIPDTRDSRTREWDYFSPETPEGRLTHFNPEDWHAPARDDKGHQSPPLRIEFPPAVIEELAAHVNSGKFPLGRSVVQAVRVAVFEFLCLLRKLNPLPRSNMTYIEMLNYLNFHAETIYKYEEQFTIGKQKAHKLIAMGAHNEARKHVHNLIAVAKGIEQQELREKYVWELEREFRKLLLKSRGNVVKTNVRMNEKKRVLKIEKMMRGEIV